MQENLESAKNYREERSHEWDRLAAEEAQRSEQLREAAQQTQWELKENVKQAKQELLGQKTSNAAVVKKQSQTNEVRLAQLMQLERYVGTGVVEVGTCPPSPTKKPTPHPSLRLVHVPREGMDIRGMRCHKGWS